MISKIKIRNFKSIVDLTLDLGRINLFIGENGSGKSNILEAIAFLSIQKVTVDGSTLLAKGARVTKPPLYGSGFEPGLKPILFDYTIDGNPYSSVYKYINGNENNWMETTAFEKSSEFAKFLAVNDPFISYDSFDFIPYFNATSIRINSNTPQEKVDKIVDESAAFEKYYKHRYDGYINRFMIYSPEVSQLRKFEEEGQITPLGSRGEGLFSLIKSMAHQNDGLQQIKESLSLIDWFEDFSIPADLLSNEFKINIRDKYINATLQELDQRSANEGFLFLLFYTALFSSSKTPSFFAVDNIEASFNPKLCARLLNLLADLATKNEKQVLLTTHNPATLDGLNLNDPEQRLFVVRRNLNGHTIVTRITEKPKLSTPMKLSDMWTKGFIGGLPENF